MYVLPVKQGAYVQAGELLLQVADLSRVLVRAYVDEPDIGRLVAGINTEVTWDALPGRIWERRRDHAALHRQVPWHTQCRRNCSLLDNRDFRLLPNTNVSVTIIIAQHDGVLTIPREALRHDDSKPYVYQIVNEQATSAPVAVAASNLTRVESGRARDKPWSRLNTMSTVNKSLRDGIPVKVVQ